MDIDVARELVRAGSDRYTLQRKLKDRFEDVGAVLWALHREGTLDCSTDDGWWSEMADAEGHFSAADVGQLLIAASRHEDMGGLVETWASHLSGWNVYCRSLVEAAIADPEPLVAAFRTVPEPMRSPFGVELVCHGVLDAADLPADTMDRLVGPAVREVGWQQLASKLVKVWPAERIGPALNEAAATPGNDIWSLGFLEWSEPFLTPDTLAGIALNIDYADTVAKMLAVMDRHPEGLKDAILARRASGQTPADFGVTALGWIARQGSLDRALAEALLKELKDDLHDEVLASILPAVPVDLLEPWVLANLRDRDLRAVASCCTPKTAAAAIAIVAKAGRGDFRAKGIEAAFSAIARAQPALLCAALAKKVPHRVIFVKGLGAATDPVVLPTLVASLGDTVAEVRQAAAAALAAFGPTALDVVAEALGSRKKDVRLAAADALVGIGGPRAQELAESALGAEKEEEIRERLVTLTTAAAPSTEAWVEARRGALPEATKEAWDAVWNEVPETLTPADGAAKVVAEHGADAVIVAYDGLFRCGGTTTSKLAIWQAVLERSAVDAENAELAIRMVVGWPMGTDRFDDTIEAHDGAIRAFYAAVRPLYGDLLVPGVCKVLAEADGSGHDELWAFGLACGWPEVRALLPTLSAKASRRFLEDTVRALGAEALPILAERLAARTADVRQTAAEILEAVPLAEALPVLEVRLAADRSAPVRTALARAAFAAASVGAPPLGGLPIEAFDARLAAFPPPVPAGAEGLSGGSWSTGAPLSDGAAAFVLGRLSEESASHHDPVWSEIGPRLDPATRHQLWQGLAARFAGQEVARTGWVLFSSAILADDKVMRALGKTLDDEARGGASAVAFYKLEVLARHGGKAALAWLDHWARHARSQGLKVRAEDALDAAAARLGVSRDTIADRSTSDLGFARDGTRPLPMAGRALSVRLRPTGALELLDEKGAPLAKVPSAATKDEKAAFTALKKEAQSVARAAAERLEQAMVTGRRIERDEHAATFGANPVLAVVAAGVVWAAFVDGVPTATLRLAEGGLVDLEGDPWIWPDGATLGVVHPLELAADDRVAVADRIASSGHLPPFRQLDRPVHAVDTEEGALKRLERYERDRFATRRLRSTLTTRGWTRGVPQDGGAVQWFTKPFPRAGLTAVIRMSPGFTIGGGDEDDQQQVPAVEFVPGRYGRDLPWRLDPIPPARVDVIAFSEVVADVEAARGV